VFLETISGDISRITIWQNSVELWKLLWVTGTGLGTFQTVYTQFFLPAGEKEFIHAHNIFLNVGIELGLVGLLLFVVLGFQFIYYGVFLGRQKWPKSSFLGSINIGLAALVFGYLIRCLFDYTI
jgi:O-antigen ligase